MPDRDHLAEYPFHVVGRDGSLTPVAQPYPKDRWLVAFIPVRTQDD